MRVRERLAAHDLVVGRDRLEELRRAIAEQIVGVVEVDPALRKALG